MTTFYLAANRAVRCRAELAGPGAGSTARLPSLAGSVLTSFFLPQDGPEQGAAAPQSPPWSVSVASGTLELCGVQVWNQPCSHQKHLGSWDREGWAAGPVPTRTVDAPTLSFLWAKAECYSSVESVNPFQRQQNWKKLVRDGSCRKRQSKCFSPCTASDSFCGRGLTGEACSLTLPGDNWGSPSLSWFCLGSRGPCPTLCKKKD